jgi:NTP pyrophosphatase (non-canonical NTP hydrolase)
MQHTIAWDLAVQCAEDSNLWFPGAGSSLAHHTLALAGEVGELANIVKKIERGSLSIHDAAVKKELAMEQADIFTYLLNTAHLTRVDLIRAYEEKRRINAQRFGRK